MKKYIAFLSVTLIVVLSLVLAVTPALADGLTANVTLSEISIVESTSNVTVSGSVTITATSDVHGNTCVAYADSYASVSINGTEQDSNYEMDLNSGDQSASADASQIYNWSFVLTDTGIFVISHSGTAYVWYDKKGVGSGQEFIDTDNATAEITVTIEEAGGEGTEGEGTEGEGTEGEGTEGEGTEGEGTEGEGTNGIVETGDEAEAGVDEEILYLMTLEESGQFYLVVRFGWGASYYRIDGDDWSNQITTRITASGVYGGTRYMFTIPEDTVISSHDGGHVYSVFFSAFDGDTITASCPEMVFSKPVTVYRCDGDWYKDINGYWVGGTLVEIGSFTEIVDFTATLENS